MKEETNKLLTTYKELSKEIKTRGGKVTKLDFFNYISDLVSKEELDKFVIKHSPFEYLVNEKMQSDPKYLEKVKALYESEIGSLN